MRGIVDGLNGILVPYLGDYGQWKVLAALLCLPVVWSFGRDVVTADREVIEVDTRLPLLSWKVWRTRRFLVSELEEMILDKNTLVLVSDTARVTIIIWNLDSDDARFLHDSILYAIAR